MSPSDRERHLERVGRICPRVDPHLVTEGAIECAHELMSHAANAAGLGEWVWQRHARDVPVSLRHRFFRWVNLYMSEYRDAEAALAKVKSKEKSAARKAAHSAAPRRMPRVGRRR